MHFRARVALLLCLLAVLVGQVRPAGAVRGHRHDRHSRTALERERYRVARAAVDARGTPYVYGGESPRGFDCSGLVRWVYAKVHRWLPHNAAAQYYATRPAHGKLRRGDLVFFYHLEHVGIYIGNGEFVHAPHTGARVRLDKLSGWYRSNLDAVHRVLVSAS